MGLRRPEVWAVSFISYFTSNKALHLFRLQLPSLTTGCRKYLLGACYGPDSVLDAQDMTIKATSSPTEWVGGLDNVSLPVAQRLQAQETETAGICPQVLQQLLISNKL